MAYLQRWKQLFALVTQAYSTSSQHLPRAKSFLSPLNLSIIQRLPKLGKLDLCAKGKLPKWHSLSRGLFCVSHQLFSPQDFIILVLGEDSFRVAPFKIIVNEEQIFPISHYFCFMRLRRKSVNMCS